MNSTEQSFSDDEVLDAFRHIRVFEHPEDGKRAVNKPLLLLLALGYAQREKRRLLSFVEIEPKLTSLLREFGPHRATYSASLPFWYLQNDDDGQLWEIENASNLTPRKGKKNLPSTAELRRQKAIAGLSPSVFDALVKSPKLLHDAARELLVRHFPETLHEDIADAVGLNLDVANIGKGIRDPRFRAMMLNAYDQRCAICGFDARLGGKNVGLEAAHIRWVQMRGSNEVCNGMAMCSLHHKLFDAGAFTIEFTTGVYRVLFSGALSGASDAFRKWILRSHRTNLDLLPLEKTNQPNPDSLRWHYREVFKRPPLQLDSLVM